MTGEVALGVVVTQEMVGRKKAHSKIGYEFKDQHGALRYGEGVDQTKRYFPGYPVVVFYSSKTPYKNLAICCTDWRIRTKRATLSNLKQHQRFPFPFQ